MRRFLPVIIILCVAIITAATAAWFYHEKMRPDAVKPAPALATEKESTPSSTIPPDIAAPPDTAPVAESLHARGAADAPVTLEIYGDFQCPSCAKTTALIDEIEQSYGPKLRVVFYEFPLKMHAHALEAAMAAEAAGVQGHFWEMHDALYKYQDIWSKVSDPGRFFAVYAQTIGLNVSQFQQDRQSEQIKNQIMIQGDAGVARGVRNTPTLFVNGQQVKGIFDPLSLRSEIDAALGKKKGS